MRGRRRVAAFAVLAVAVMAAARNSSGQTPPAAAAQLRPPAAFAGIAGRRARAIALFTEAGKVLKHPRCLNCHTGTDQPRQTDAMRPHEPLVVRGESGQGAPGMICGTCHHPDNYDPARVPGTDAWQLAPASMGWEGRSLGQICAQLKDRTRNGGRDLGAVLSHVAADNLILWAWSPGVGRTPAPGTHAAFVALMQAWVGAGAHCPPP